MTPVTKLLQNYGMGKVSIHFLWFYDFEVLCVRKNSDVSYEHTWVLDGNLFSSLDLALSLNHTECNKITLQFMSEKFDKLSRPQPHSCYSWICHR